MKREDIKVIIGLIDRRIRESALRSSRGSGGIDAYMLHTQLRDMPSAVVADHDGRYYTETELSSVQVGQGASLIGIQDAGGYYGATNIEAALQEIIGSGLVVTSLGKYGDGQVLRGDVKLKEGTNVTLTRDDPNNAIIITVSGGVVGSGVQIITNDDPALGPREILHFINGSGIAITSVDDPIEEEIEITITCTASGVGGTTVEIQEDDIKIADVTIINFEGGGGKVTDEGGGKVTVDITGGGGGYTECARVYNSENLTIPNITYTALTFDSERFDTDGIHSVVADTSRLTCKTAGKYQITINIGWDDNSSGRRILRLTLNDTTMIAQVEYPITAYLVQFLTTLWDMNVDDYVEAFVYQNSGSNRTVLASSARSPEFMMVKVG